MKTERSESIANLAAALAVAQGQMKSAAKDNVAKVKTNAGGGFTYKYSTLDDIWAVARKPLSDNGLSIVQIPLTSDGGLVLETILAHASGEFISARMVLPVLSDRMSEVQALGSAITYARRYMLGAMVGVTAGDDDDDGATAGTIASAQYPPARTNGQIKHNQAFDDFLAKTRVELNLSEDNTKAILKELGIKGFNPSRADELFAMLNYQLTESASTETAAFLVVNGQTDNYYQHINHFRNAVKQIDAGINYPPEISQIDEWQAIIKLLIDHASAPAGK